MGLLVDLLPLAYFALYLYAALTIAWRAGYRSGWVYAFVLVPGLNIVGLGILTFREWPVERRLRETQQQVASSGVRAERPEE